MILKNIFYAIMLGIGMAACLSQNDRDGEEATAADTTPDLLTDTTEPATTTPKPEDLAIVPGRVGFVTIGEPMEQMRQNIPAGFTIADTTLQQEGMQSTAYLIKPEKNSKGILVEQQCNASCNVWRINVLSDLYKTTKGVGVGATYSQARQQYPISTVLLADGGLVAVAKEDGITFVLDTSQIPEKQRSKLTPATVPPATRIKSILIY